MIRSTSRSSFLLRMILSENRFHFPGSCDSELTVTEVTENLSVVTAGPHPLRPSGRTRGVAGGVASVDRGLFRGDAAVVFDLGQFFHPVRLLRSGGDARACHHRAADRGRLRPFGRRDADAVFGRDRRSQCVDADADPPGAGDRHRDRRDRRPGQRAVHLVLPDIRRWSSRWAPPR